MNKKGSKAKTSQIDGIAQIDGIDGIDGIDLQVMATTIDETATTNTNPWKSTTKPMSCG